MNRHDLLRSLKFLALSLLTGIVLALVFQTCDIKPALAEKVFEGVEVEPTKPVALPPRGAVAFLLARDHTPQNDPRWRDTERFEWALINAAQANGVDPALFIAMAYKESSFETSARGKIGELGLVQVHGMAKRGCELETPEGQAECGARWLARVSKFCGDAVALSVERCRERPSKAACSGGLAAYASGRCAASEAVMGIVRKRLKIAEKIRPYLLGIDDETLANTAGY